MHKSILVTGIAGSGKSTVCAELKNLGFEAYDIEDLPGFFEMIDRKTGKPPLKYDNDDLAIVKQNEWICDTTKLERLIFNNKSGIVFYCGTGENLSKVYSLFDKVFLLVANKTVLKERLSERPVGDFGRKSDVQKWVFSWKKSWEDRLREKGAIVIKSSGDLRTVTKRIANLSK